MSTHARHTRSGDNIKSDFNEVADQWLRIILSGELLIKEFQVKSV